MLLLVHTLTMLKKKRKGMKEEAPLKYFTTQLMPFSVQLHTSRILFFDYFSSMCFFKACVMNIIIFWGIQELLPACRNLSKSSEIFC